MKKSTTLTRNIDNTENNNKLQYDPNKINIRYTSPLDKLFERLDEILKSSIVQNPNKKIIPSTKTFTRTQLLYNALSESEIAHTKDNILSITDYRSQEPSFNSIAEDHDFLVIAFFCQSLIKIQHFLEEIKTSPESKTEPNNKNKTNPEMIAISLNDMKTLNIILNIIIIDGIYPCLTPGVGIPINLRIKQSNMQQKGIIQPTTDNGPDNISENSKFLRLAYILEQTLIPCITKKENGHSDDLRNIILISSYFPDLISVAAELAFNPKNRELNLTRYSQESDFNSEENLKRKLSELYKNYNFILDQIDTYSLYLNLTSLIRPKSPKWLLSNITKSLASIPVRRPHNGVSALIEFISGIREMSASNKGVDINNLDKAIQILKSVPASFLQSQAKKIQYYKLIGNQLISIIGSPQNILQRPMFLSATIHIIEKLYDQKREMILYGIENQLIETINPTLPETLETTQTKNLLVTGPSLQQALNAFSSLVNSHQLVPLTQSIGKRIFVALWSLLCFSKKHELALTPTTKEDTEKNNLFDQVKYLLVNLIISQPKNEDKEGVQKLLVKYFLAPSGSPHTWKYAIEPEISASKGNICIRKCNYSDTFETDGITNSLHHSIQSNNFINLESQLQLFDDIDFRISIFLQDILGGLKQYESEVSDSEEKNLQAEFVSSLFVYLLKEWLQFRQLSDSSNEPIKNPISEISLLPLEESQEKADDTINALVNAKLLQGIYEGHKEDLLKFPLQLLLIIHTTLEEYATVLEKKFGDNSDSFKNKPIIDDTIEEFTIKSDKNSILDSLKFIHSEIESSSNMDSDEMDDLPKSIKNLVVLDDESKTDTKTNSNNQQPIAGNEEPLEDEDDNSIEIVEICISLLFAITDDIFETASAKQAIDKNIISQIKTLEAILPQLEFIVSNFDVLPESHQSGTSLIKEKIITCQTSIQNVLTTYLPDYDSETHEKGNNNSLIKDEYDSFISESKAKLSRAVKLLQDPLIPVQANALYILKTLIDSTYLGNSKSKSNTVSSKTETINPVVRENWKLILEIYLSKIQSDDSFIYLNAIKGLCALCEKFIKLRYFPNNDADKTKKENDTDFDVLIHLLQLYISPTTFAVKKKEPIKQSFSADLDSSTEQQLRIGEVLLQLISRLKSKSLFKDRVVNVIVSPIIEMIKPTSSILKQNSKNINILRMSAISILSSCFDGPLSYWIMENNHWTWEVFDCALGILKSEIIHVGLEPSYKKEMNEDEKIIKDNIQVEKEAKQSGIILVRRAALSLLASIFKSMPDKHALTRLLFSNSIKSDPNQIKISAAFSRDNNDPFGLISQLEIASQDRDPIIRSNAIETMRIINDLEIQ